MEAPLFLNDTTAGAGTLESLPRDARSCRAIIVGSAFVRFGCAALLLIAATLKTYQLFIDPAVEVVHMSRWLQVGFIEYEVLLAVWLLSEARSQWGRRVALVTFLSFGCYAFFLGITGETSCGCFGKVQVSPWWTFGIDAALVILLVFWNPPRVRDGSKPAPGYGRFAARVFLVVAALFAVIGITALSIAVRPPGSDLSIESVLANSRIVLLEPENWIGKPFPLADYIDISERDRLSRGSWIVVFYHHDCLMCQQSLPRYEQLSKRLISANEDTHIALIEIPPYGSTVLPTGQLCHLGRLNDTKEWIIMTPAEVRVKNGKVIAATFGVISDGP